MTTRDERIDAAFKELVNLDYIDSVDEYGRAVLEKLLPPAPHFDPAVPITQIGRMDLERELLEWRKRG